LPSLYPILPWDIILDRVEKQNASKQNRFEEKASIASKALVTALSFSIDLTFICPNNYIQRRVLNYIKKI
jgi:hypothetical protein